MHEKRTAEVHPSRLGIMILIPLPALRSSIQLGENIISISTLSLKARVHDSGLRRSRCCCSKRRQRSRPSSIRDDNNPLLLGGLDTHSADVLIVFHSKCCSVVDNKGRRELSISRLLLIIHPLAPSSLIPFLIGPSRKLSDFLVGRP